MSNKNNPLPTSPKGGGVASVQAGFGLPFAEQIAFFNQKVRLPTKDHNELKAHQHDKAFVVAGAMKADLLADLYTAVGKAIEDGESIGQFRKRFDEIVQKRGWQPKTPSNSPLAEGEQKAWDKDYLSWRTKIIYTTNLRTSHAAGRYQQMTTPEMLTARPYWQYRHVTRENPRLNHKRHHKKVYRADDSWWLRNYAPNGYGCNCYIRALSKRDLERLGITVSDAPSDDIAQDGFAHAFGSTWQPNLDKYPFPVAKSLVAENMADGVFERWIARMQLQKNEVADKLEGADKASRVATMRAMDNKESFAVAVLSPEQKMLLDSETAVIHLSESDALKQVISREGNRGFDSSSYTKVQRVLDNATLIVRQIHKPTGELSHRTLWVEGMIEGKKSRYSAVLHQTRDKKEIYLKSYRLDSTKDHAIKKRGVVLYEKGEI